MGKQVAVFRFDTITADYSIRSIYINCTKEIALMTRFGAMEEQCALRRKDIVLAADEKDWAGAR